MGPGTRISNINESLLQTYESKTLFLMTSLQYYCIPGLAEIKLMHKRCRIKNPTVISIWLLVGYLHLHLCCTRCPSHLTIKARVVASLKRVKRNDRKDRSENKK